MRGARARMTYQAPVLPPSVPLSRSIHSLKLWSKIKSEEIGLPRTASRPASLPGRESPSGHKERRRGGEDRQRRVEGRLLKRTKEERRVGWMEGGREGGSMVKILKRAPPTTTTSSSLVCIKGRGRIEGGGMDGGMVGWNDCGWKMINQSCSAVLDSLARQLSFHSLGQAGSTGLLLTQLAVIFSPPLLPPSLPPDIVPLLFRSFLSAAADFFCRSKGPFYLNSRIYCSHSLRALLIAFALACPAGVGTAPR